MWSNVAGSVVHTGQLYFHEAVNTAVYKRAPYRAHTGRRTTNAADMIYGNGGARSTVAIATSGSGYVGRETLAVQR